MFVWMVLMVVWHMRLSYTLQNLDVYLYLDTTVVCKFFMLPLVVKMLQGPVFDL